jgi:hypothetical protein
MSLGGLLYVCVGFTLYHNELFWVLSEGIVGSTKTGSSLSAMRVRFSWREKARYQRGLRGPKTSILSKDGKSATAQFFGADSGRVLICVVRRHVFW